MTKETLFNEAVAYAAMKHAGQTRKDGSPYIYHPLKVAELVKETGYDLNYQIAAVLHDTLEDTDATEDEIRLFGEDVLEAVRLVTRPEGMSEDVYVARILENHMAAAVKNADKIHNMIDLRTCGNPEWAKKYTEKVKKYYRGKFSGTLDTIIDDIKVAPRDSGVFGQYYFCSKDGMRLYSDKKIQRYNENKEWYFKNTRHPDFENPNMQYWYESFIKYYFCFSKEGECWILGPAGWKPTKNSPFLEDEYGTYLQKRCREDVDAYIEKMKAKDYFYDFVDMTKL